MTRPASILLCLALASCAPIPRAIIPPPSVVEILDVAPVVHAGKATRDAVRDVSAAGHASREAGRKVSDATRRLSDSISRIETLSFANEELTRSVKESLDFAKELEAEVIALTAAHTLAEEKEKIATSTIDSLIDETAVLKANAESQSVQIRHAKTNETVLREQVEALSGSDAKRIIAENQLQFWRWRFAPMSIGLVVIMAAFLILKPRFL